MKPVPNCVPHLIGNEAQYLAECVATGWVSPVGPFVDRFEQQFAAYHGMTQAASVSINASPAFGPSAIAIATARLSETIGEGCILSSTS